MKDARFIGAMAAALLLVPTSGAFAAVTMSVTNAVYRVPVAAGSEEHARFTVQDLAFTGESGSRHISFRLPADLSGGKTTVVDLKELASPPGAAFVGFGGDSPSEAASCTLGAGVALCLIRYKAKAMPAAEIERFLSAKYHGTALVRPRLAVALSYQNEPAGFLGFNFSGK